MRGLAIGRSCFVAWSGKLARVHRVDTQVHRVEALNQIPTNCTAMAIADATHINSEVWLTAEQHCVKIMNFTGGIITTISFSETEGNIYIYIYIY